VFCLVLGLSFFSLGQANTHANDQVKIPATVPAIWKAIDEQVAMLDKVINNNQLDKVHHHAFAIRDLVAALPQHSQALPAKQLATVKSYTKHVATVAKRLDASGDSNDKSGTVANFKKLKKLLSVLRGYYPQAMDDKNQP